MVLITFFDFFRRTRNFLFRSHLGVSPPLTSKSSAQQHLSHESGLTSEFTVPKDLTSSRVFLRTQTHLSARTHPRVLLSPLFLAGALMERDNPLSAGSLCRKAIV